MTNHSVRHLAVPLATLAVALCPSTAWCSFITSVTGDVADSGPVPATLQANAQSSNTVIFLFRERSGVFLDAPLTVDRIDPGTYISPDSFVLPAGTVIDSYLLHYDRVGGGGDASGSVTFDGTIVGVIGRLTGLDASDPIVGGAGTLYPLSVGRRFWDSGAGDSVTISADRRTLSLTTRADAGGMDELRVLATATSVVPEPSTLVLAGVAALSLFRYRRRDTRS